MLETYYRYRLNYKDYIINAIDSFSHIILILIIIIFFVFVYLFYRKRLKENKKTLENNK